jgi:hypothetical protein
VFSAILISATEVSKPILIRRRRRKAMGSEDRIPKKAGPANSFPLVMLIKLAGKATPYAIARSSRTTR